MNKSRNQLKTYTLHNYQSIPQIAGIPKEFVRDIEIVGRVLPFKTNNYVIDELIDWDNIETDPIFTLNFPRRGMLDKKHYAIVEKLLDGNAEKSFIDAKIQEIRFNIPKTKTTFFQNESYINTQIKAVSQRPLFNNYGFINTK